MKKVFKKWELVVGEIARRGVEEVLAFLAMDVLTMIFTVGIITILCAITEAFIGAPNWPEVIIGWLLVYGVCFHCLIEIMAIALCSDDLGTTTIDRLIEYKRQRFDEEI